MTRPHLTITANLVDIPGRQIVPTELTVAAGNIASLQPTATTPSTYILPGFVDAHVHVESSLLTPAEFARAAVVHAASEAPSALATEG